MRHDDWLSAWGVLRSLAIYWRPGRQRSLQRLYRPFVPKGGLVFDIGAHVGDRTWAFAQLGARVVALEPQPQLWYWLQRRVGRLPAVVLRAAAVGRSPGEAVLAVSRANPTVSTLSDFWATELGRRNVSFRRVEWDRSATVPVVTLDALITEFGVPDFCKIDVEGFEAEVLSGLTQPLPALSLEFVAGALAIAEQCVLRLTELGEYEFNAVAGERREFLFRQWQPPAALLGWLRTGAGGTGSGDIYARQLVSGAHEARS